MEWAGCYFRLRLLRINICKMNIIKNKQKIIWSRHCDNTGIVTAMDLFLHLTMTKQSS